MSVLRTTLAEVFRFSSFRPGQEQVCEALIAGRSAVAVFPTGAGKSLCYQLPALHLDGTTIVVSPLLALMKDQVDWLISKNIAAARLDSTLSLSETLAVYDALGTPRLKLLYVAPERFLNERFIERVARANIPMLAIDEAHCISQWGHNFRPEYLKLARHAERLIIPRILALTATATPRVVDDIAAAFKIDTRDRVVTGFYRPNLTLTYVPTTRADRDRRLLELPIVGPTIVYVTLQKTAERIAKLLAEAGQSALAYHAGIESEAREQIQDAFMSGRTQIIVATIAFGMGIDKSNIRNVIHYNLPKTLESYAQEIGRAGRDGKTANCTMFACRDDLPTLANFAYGDTPTFEAIHGVIGLLLGKEDETWIAYRSLANRHDMRELVVKTLVTYLELDGWIRQGTPVFTEYKWKFAVPKAVVLAGFDQARAAFLAAVFGAARTAKIWSYLDLTAAAESLGEPRERIIRALDYLADKGQIELVATGVQERVVVLRRPESRESLAVSYFTRFEAMETREVARVREIGGFIEGNSCHTARLVAYFGETLPGPCGHCSFCLAGSVRLPPETPPAPLPPRESFGALCAEHPVLQNPRSFARFLCGITSPALTRARLSHHPLFGSAADADFRDVMRWADRS